MTGKTVFTGQENVQGSAKAMREDLYKKMLSADPVAVRLPYAILTKLIEFIGWKRFEMNQLMRFAGVTEGSFDSIMRRSCVVEFKARFTTPDKIRKLGGEEHCAAIGVFKRDASLKNFLKSPDAVKYTLKQLRGFAEEHSLDECEQIIEAYVDGLDEGLTRRTMRASCGLKEEPGKVSGPFGDLLKTLHQPLPQPTCMNVPQRMHIACGTVCSNKAKRSAMQGYRRMHGRLNC